MEIADRPGGVSLRYVNSRCVTGLSHWCFLWKPRHISGCLLVAVNPIQQLPSYFLHRWLSMTGFWLEECDQCWEIVPHPGLFSGKGAHSSKQNPLG